jgi:dihydrofolate reductase
MSQVRVCCFTLSLDGFGAGPEQSLQSPMGQGGEHLHQWFMPTRTCQAMLFGKSEGTTGVDDQFAQRGIANLGAWILGRNMFGPVRGPWQDDSWQGWWGEEPPYHCPVFVLSHQRHPRGAGACARGRQRERRARGRWRGHRAPIRAGGLGR